MSSKKEKELEKLLRKSVLLMRAFTEARELDLSRMQLDVSVKIEQKITGHRSQRRKK